MYAVFAEVIERVYAPERRKFIRYSLVSIISAVVTEVILDVCYWLFHISGGWSAIYSSTTAAIPSYYLNRSWVWGKSGRSHIRKEVVPFWVLAAIGLAVAFFVSDLGDQYAQYLKTSHTVSTVIVTSANILGFLILWVVKYVIFNKILFANREEELDPALDGRSGIPT